MFGDPAINSKGLPVAKLPDLGENLDNKRIPITGGNRKAGEYPYYGASGIVDYVADYIFDDDLLLISEDGANLVARVTPIAFPSTGKVWINNHAHVIKFKSMAMQCYVESLLNMMDISPYVTGTAQPKLNQAKLNSIPIPVPEESQIREYLEFVKQSDKSKFVRFKSQFIEMFGELGKDDKGWGITTLGECCELNPKRPRVIDDELLVSFVPMPAVSEDGKIDCSDIKPYKEVRKGFTYFAENDVLFAKITPCMENGKGAVAKGLEGGIGFGSTEFHVLRPIAGKSNPYWLYILTMFESFRVGARKVMTGTGGQLRVPIGYLNDYSITLPPIDLQDRFEEFVHQSDKSK